MHNGALPLTEETLELLLQKDPDPLKSSPDILIQQTTRSIHPITDNGIDELLVVKALI